MTGGNLTRRWRSKSGKQLTHMLGLGHANVGLATGPSCEVEKFNLDPNQELIQSVCVSHSYSIHHQLSQLHSFNIMSGNPHVLAAGTDPGFCNWGGGGGLLQLGWLDVW